MKHALNISLVIGICLLLVACGKPDKVLPKNEGLWRVVSMSDQVFQSNSLVIDTTFEVAFTEEYFFKDDGTGTFLDGSFSADFTWSYSNDTKNLRLTFTEPTLLIWDYQVLQSKRKSQSWLIDYSIPSGSPDRLERTFGLERIE